MGIDRMAEFMKTFGYGALTGIDIPGEKAGLYASPEWKRHAFKRAADQVWFGGETISMGIGQGAITVTPLQQAHFVAEIGERGRVIATPRLVAAISAAVSSRIGPPTCWAWSRPPTRKNRWSFQPRRRSKSRRQAHRSDARARRSLRAPEPPLDRINDFMEFFDPERRPDS